jgi:hypothetical protein
MHIRTLTSLAAAAALALLLSALPGPPATAAPLAPAPTPVPDAGGTDELVDAARAALGLSAAEVASLELPESIAAQMRIDVPVGDETLALDLHPVNVRADGFILRAQVADGSFVDVDPGPARTVRGTVSDVPGSRAAGSLLDDGLHLTIVLPDGGRYWIQPIADLVPGAAANDHVIYHDDDVLPVEGTCGVTDKLIAEQAIFDVPADPMQGGGIAGTEFFSCTEIGIDADVEFFNIFGTVDAVENRVSLVINTVNLQYESEVNITHIITAIIVRTSEPDPYSTTDPGGLLNQFTNEWNTNQGSIPRDVAHLFTGKNLAGSVIGIAWISSVCTTQGYGLVQHQSGVRHRPQRPRAGAQLERGPLQLPGLHDERHAGRLQQHVPSHGDDSPDRRVPHQPDVPGDLRRRAADLHAPALRRLPADALRYGEVDRRGRGGDQLQRHRRAERAVHRQHQRFRPAAQRDPRR